MTFKPIIIICGHYGSGKTTFSLNLAEKLAKTCPVTLVDMDIVNPYFRSSDYRSTLEKTGIRVVAPNFAGSMLDTPSLSPEITGAIDSARNGGYVIIDAGGDDAGAISLGCFSKQISAFDYDMLYIINERREQVSDAAGAKEILDEIEAASHLKCTAIVNNTHLCRETVAENIISSTEYAENVCNYCNLPLAFTCYPDFTGEETAKRIPFPFKINPMVRAPW